MSDDDYDVGYGRPPRHSQFVPGQSGNKGRKKKRETPGEMMARIRDETVHVQGQTITKLELALQSAFTHTIKGGKARDLKGLLELLDKYGALPKWEEEQKTQAGADKAMEMIFQHFERAGVIDPRSRTVINPLARKETEMVLACKTCGPVLQRQWHEKARKKLAAEGLTTPLQRAADEITKSRY